jgi:purine nucleosidase
VIGSHLRAGDAWDPSPDTADRAAAEARRVIDLTGRAGEIDIVAGSNVALTDQSTPIATPSTDAIIGEAMRDDTDLPLYLACGAGLTEVASAWLMEPRIAERLIVVWIGGPEHDGLADLPTGADEIEYNLAIDPLAGQVLFNQSDLTIWQVPRNVYRSVIASRAELLVRMLPHGELGRYLFDALARVVARWSRPWRSFGECYVLGDSPLVLLTALMTPFEPTPASSASITVPCPTINDAGRYEHNVDGRPLRVYTQLDCRLLLEDLYAKLELHAMASAASNDT